MTLNQSGQSMQWENNTYSIGDRIIVQPEYLYAGLCGTIIEIRTGEDRHCDNDSVEIICKLMAPVLPDEIAAFEERFSKNCGEDTILADIPLEAVILEPKRIHILCQDTDPVELPIYILREDWAVDGDYGLSMFITADYHEARWEMHEMIHRDMKEGVLSRLLDCSDLDADYWEDHYECWRNGCYSDDHYLADIEKTSIKLSPNLAAILEQ